MFDEGIIPNTLVAHLVDVWMAVLATISKARQTTISGKDLSSRLLANARVIVVATHT